MGTRLGFRPRPLNNNAQLIIVRDVSELDNADSLLSADGADLPKDVNEAQPSSHAHGPANAKPKAKEIPVPEVREVTSYHRDYLPIFERPNTYIRSQRGAVPVEEEYVEYDLDNDDEDWLASYDQGQHRLTGEKLEKMLWRLEVACGEANERVFSNAAGGVPPERLSATQAAVIDNLPKAEALELLRQKVGGREAVLEAVYSFWAGKRLRKGKPLLRRMHAPTPVSDSNPFNVFRPREKLNRPQTRRRRENNEECLDKLKQIRQNLERAMELCNLLRRRESKKRDLVTMECEMQRLQLRLRLEPKHMHEGIEADSLKGVKAKLQAAEARDQAAAVAADSGARAKKRKRVDAVDPALMARCRAEVLATLPPAPLPPDLELLFSHRLGPQELAALQDAGMQLPGDLNLAACCVRVGRCGRLIFDRVDPVTYEPRSSPDPDAEQHTSPSPQHQQQQQPHPQSILDELFPDYVKALLQPLIVETARPAAPPHTTKPKPPTASTTPRPPPPASSNGPLRTSNTNTLAPPGPAPAASRPTSADLKPPTPKAGDGAGPSHAAGGLTNAPRRTSSDVPGASAAAAAAAAAASQVVAMGLKRGPGRPPKTGAKDVD